MPSSPLSSEEENAKLFACLAAELAQLAAKGQLPPGFTVTKDGVILREHTLRITPTSEYAGARQSKFLSAARFDVTLDGRKEEQFTFGSIGVGDSAQEARQTAAQEWYFGFGAAMFHALAGSPTSLTFDGFSIYPGLMGVRGQAPQGWVNGTDEMHLRILASLAAILPKPGPATHSLDLKLSVPPNGILEGECKFDGKTNDPVFLALKTLPWPVLPTAYLFKQAYVLVCPNKA
jgi:hypothetical protein